MYSLKITCLAVIWLTKSFGIPARPISKIILQGAQTNVMIRKTNCGTAIQVRINSQNQITKYIFSLIIFWERTHNPLKACPPPPAPMLGTVQLTSVGNTVQNGLTLFLGFMYSLWRYHLITSQPYEWNFPLRKISVPYHVARSTKMFATSHSTNFAK